MTDVVRTLFTTLTQFRTGLQARFGTGDADAYLALMRKLIHRLPHNNLLAANRAEIQAAGRSMLDEGYSSGEMRNLQSVLAGFYDLAVSEGLVGVNVIRARADNAGPVEVTVKAALAIGFSEEQCQRLQKIIQRNDIEIVAQPSGAAGQQMVGWYPFRFLLARFPTVGVDAKALLADVRKEASLCRNSGMILLTPADKAEEAKAFIGRGANRVLTFEELGSVLTDALVALERVSRRHDVRIALRVFFPENQRWELCQTENVSQTGLLVRLPKSIEQGSEIDLELNLGGGAPIRANGEVVRETVPTHEKVRGIAIRFLSFQADGKFRWDSFLRRLDTA